MYDESDGSDSEEVAFVPEQIGAKEDKDGEVSNKPTKKRAKPQDTAKPKQIPKKEEKK